MNKNNLPDFCFADNDIDNTIVIIKNGVEGYIPYENNFQKLSVDELNESIGVSKAQAAAMKTGSMFGWNVPGANPDFYNEDGSFKKSK